MYEGSRAFCYDQDLCLKSFHDISRKFTCIKNDEISPCKNVRSVRTHVRLVVVEGGTLLAAKLPATISKRHFSFLHNQHSASFMGHPDQIPAQAAQRKCCCKTSKNAKNTVISKMKWSNIPSECTVTF